MRSLVLLSVPGRLVATRYPTINASAKAANGGNIRTRFLYHAERASPSYLVDQRQEFRRHLVGEPNAVRRAIKDVAAGMHRRAIDCEDDWLAMSLADGASRVDFV
jgi:hypothetical protein